jgi:glycosyltransferase involved in cell wall biosynthesis
MKIFAFHLMNDYSGSPKVLMQLIKIWKKNDINVVLVTNSSTSGFLSNLEGVEYKYNNYSWSANKLMRLFNLIMSQLRLVIKIWGNVKQDDIIYINTVLPFGAAFLGKLKGARIIYHLHETSINPKILKLFLFGITKWAADDIIFVSKYLASTEAFPDNNSHILYNAIENNFLAKALASNPQELKYKNVLMVCSLKDYKGVNEFTNLAMINPHFNFKLVLNSSQKDIDQYFTRTDISKNLKIFSTQTNLHPFYQWTDVILNLSWTSRWIETFGLTIIEAMAYGKPAIVPPVGGIAELVTDSVNGFHVDSKNAADLTEKLNYMLINHKIYNQMSNNSNTLINNYKESVFEQNSLVILGFDESFSTNGNKFQNMEYVNHQAQLTS